jgi:hypothetical protein
MPLIVVSNRLPLSLSKGREVVRSSGGLVSALSSLSHPFLWVGATGGEALPQASLAAEGCIGVDIPSPLYNTFYVRRPF